MARRKSKARASMRDKARQAAEERERQGGGGTSLTLPDGVDFFNPEKGKNSIDLIPYIVTVSDHPHQDEGELWYERTFFKHYGIGSEDKGYICLKTFGKSCPICVHRAKLMKDPDADDDTISQLKPRQRQLFNIIDLNDTDAGVQLWEISFYNFGETLEEEDRDQEPERYFADLQEGLTLDVVFKEKKLGKNKFLVSKRIDFEERDDYDDDILDDTLDLDTILREYTYEDLDNIFMELDSQPEKEEKPSRRERPAKKEKTSSRKSSKRDKDKKKPPVEDDVPLGDEEEVEKKEKKLTRRSRTKDKKKDNKKDNPCPHGHEWGQDCDEDANRDDCDDCDKWDDCKDRQDEIWEEEKD